MPASPFSVEHFRAYCRLLVLDSGEPCDPEDFQIGVVRDVFDGFRETWMIVPEGNGKTTLMALLALYHADYQSDPWVPIGASTREQAKILFDQAAGFIERTPGMEQRFRVYHGYRRIDSKRNGGRGIQVYSADANSGDGVIPTLCLIDELHAHKDTKLYRRWRGKLDKRGGQLIAISTAGEPGSEFELLRANIRQQANKHQRAGAYLRATSGSRVVLHEWMVPDGTDPTDPFNVKAANPLSTITPAMLEAKLADPTQDLGDWMRLVCNRPTRSSQSAITEKEWDAAESDERIPEGEPVWVGLDVAWKHDTTAVVPLWMPDQSKRLFGDPRVLVPPRDGSMLNPHEIEDAFKEIHAVNPIETVVMDRERAEQLASWLEEELGCIIVEHHSGNVMMSLAYERFMEGLRGGQIRHTGDRTFRQHAMNAMARRLPNDKVRFDRPVHNRGNAKEQDRRVIDALDAASRVHSSMVAGKTVSVYEDRGVLVV